MVLVHKCANGRVINADNLEVLSKLPANFADSCISDFPYGIGFMGKQWDKGKSFYDWCYARADALIRVMKPGGYVAIFGHPKTNHRMKSAFEDAGFKIVDEIDWVYLTGMPKNQDLGKMFDKSAGVQREVVGEKRGCNTSAATFDFNYANQFYETLPASDLAKKWAGWKTAGLKPAHEPITVFQKPLEGTYIQNIEKYGCGGMNIDACRVPIMQADIDMLAAKASKNPTTNYSDRSDKIYGKYAEDKAVPANELGRFPSNLILDEFMAAALDEQTGVSKSSGGSRVFPIIKYCPKVSPSERNLANNERNPHVTLKPLELIKWLIKLLTPIDGMTIDITAGSCTHGVACEKLNREESYGLKWLDVELMNTPEEPYCAVGKTRLTILE